MTNIVWFRRNLRLDDNLPLHKASQEGMPYICIFIFDSEILKHFANENDRRIDFIADQLCSMKQSLQEKGGDLYVFYGNPQSIIPALTKHLKSNKVFADYGFEEYDQKRDNNIQETIAPTILSLSNDHLLFHPSEITKADGNPYHIFTPYMRAFRKKLAVREIQIIENNINHSVVECDWSQSPIQPLDFLTPDQLLKQCGYRYSSNLLWKTHDAQKIFESFIQYNIENYRNNRDYMSKDGTSRLSPYLRFGLVSIRKLYNSANFIDNDGRNCWINELVWREFYAMLLFHYPNIAREEMQKQYRSITWNSDQEVLKRVYNAQTGFPIIDAAICELLTTGWMHNRMRMIFASFFTKNLFLDWRLGEKFFAEHLMDYEQASNVGGWQWAASVGTDAQPYFRVFNPILQAQKFDPDAEYIKQYLPELQNIPAKDLHNPDNLKERYGVNYPDPIIDLKKSRAQAIAKFKQAREVLN